MMENTPRGQKGPIEVPVTLLPDELSRCPFNWSFPRPWAQRFLSLVSLDAVWKSHLRLLSREPKILRGNSGVRPKLRRRCAPASNIRTSSTTSARFLMFRWQIESRAVLGKYKIIIIFVNKPTIVLEWFRRDSHMRILHQDSSDWSRCRSGGSAKFIVKLSQKRA